ncbi:hypothetical protein K450DRAFT_230861 [Umbelopsis ramanniana AG]|uniref:Uncharacterized protein n=1 Tax=Umbelopsis ramanniana AG TaxID=1314678 RepID=A0AAD5EDJ1_UMBRA|nr:uncharacterized protein K450DRAFT_230861 [Umbelopsis ramanniana AG]KAI8581738.1 hypothetical protein K450DRAFT_230861 [Umbelopsis ramanniana AG]
MITCFFMNLANSLTLSIGLTLSCIRKWRLFTRLKQFSAGRVTASFGSVNLPFNSIKVFQYNKQ